MLHPSIEQRLRAVEARYEELNNLLADADIVTDNTVFDLGEGPDDHVIGDTGSGEDTNAGPDFTAIADNCRSGDISIRMNDRTFPDVDLPFDGNPAFQ